jgi:saccharopine dehydrogenase (NAD+, L-lysine-forming)
MTFGEAYIKHLEVFKSIGLISLEPIKHKGMDIIPMEFLRDLLPAPSSLAEGYSGKTSIGVIVRGKKDGKPLTKMLYNVCDHAETNKEVGAQAVSYTTGVPPVSGAAMFFRGIWKGPGVFNVEQFPAKPFLDDVAKRGLPTTIIDVGPGDQDQLFEVVT